MDPAASAEPIRDFMPSMPGWVEPVMYVTFAIIVVLVARDATLRLRRYGIGLRQFVRDVAGAVARSPRAVLGTLGRDVVGQTRLRRDRRAGLFHTLIFGPFVVLTIGTGLIALERDVTARVDVHFLRGWFYLAYEVILDAAGVLLIVGISLALVRRYRRPPAHLGTRRSIPLVHGLLLFAVLSGFLLEALRLLAHPVPWGGYSWVGSAVAAIIGPVVGGRELELYWGLWAAHFVGAFGGMAIILRTALDHVLVLPANIALQADRDPARLSLPFNLSTMDEAALAEISAGAGDARQLPWRLQFSLDTCVRCGRCDRACPALAAGRPLSPQAVVQALGAPLRATSGNGTGDGDVFRRGDLEEATAWSCLVCGACAAECPAWIDQPGTIVELRRHLVGEGRLDREQAALAANVERNGNPFGLPSFERGDWLEALGVPSVRDLPDAEYLYWIGCMASYDPVARSVAESMVRLLRHARVSFAVLGSEERCLGESLRKMGDEAGFQVRAMENVALLQEVGARRILTHCPHCLVTLARDYPSFGGTFEVVHHTELLRQLFEQGRLPLPATGAERGLTYHDPCNLGRLGGQFEAPREVARALAGGRFVEPELTRDRGFCCGAGGGNSWWTVPEGTKVSHLRLAQLRATGAATAATACPYCLTMLRDAAVVTGDGIRVADLAELVAVSLPAGAEAPSAGAESLPSGAVSLPAGAEAPSAEAESLPSGAESPTSGVEPPPPSGPL